MSKDCSYVKGLGVKNVGPPLCPSGISFSTFIKDVCCVPLRDLQQPVLNLVQN